MNTFRVAILTAKEVEFDAVRKHLIEERREDNTFDGTVYRIAKIRQKVDSDIPIPKWDVAIYRTGRGQQPTTYGTQVLMQHFRPDIVLYIGVAGGDPSHPDLSVGDVVVGKVVRYYEQTSQKENEFTFKDSSHEPNRALVSAAEFEADDSTWLERLVGERPNTRVFVDEIASGEKVQKSSNSDLWNAIKARYSDVIAVETEGHGFHYAVAQSSGRGIMIRSISDMLDNKDNDESEHGTDDERQLIASKHAAAFSINLICNLNTGFLEKEPIEAEIFYSVILKVSATDLAGVQRVTQVLSEIVNDPHLKLESLQPANSFIIRVATTIQSASYAHAIYRGRLISKLIGLKVYSLQADVERTGDIVFDEFLAEVMRGAVSADVSNKIKEKYPSWNRSIELLEKTIGAIQRDRESRDKKKTKYLVIEQISGQKKIETIKEVRALSGLGLKDAKDIVENPPQLLKSFASQKDATIAAQSLRNVGASVRVLSSLSSVRKLVGKQRQIAPEMEQAIR